MAQDRHQSTRNEAHVPTYVRTVLRRTMYLHKTVNRSIFTSFEVEKNWKTAEYCTAVTKQCETQQKVYEKRVNKSQNVCR